MRAEDMEPFNFATLFHAIGETFHRAWGAPIDELDLRAGWRAAALMLDALRNGCVPEYCVHAMCRGWIACERLLPDVNLHKRLDRGARHTFLHNALHRGEKEAATLNMPPPHDDLWPTLRVRMNDDSGVALFSHSRRDECLNILYIYVHSRARGAGLGRSLVHAAYSRIYPLVGTALRFYVDERLPHAAAYTRWVRAVFHAHPVTPPWQTTKRAASRVYSVYECRPGFLNLITSRLQHAGALSNSANLQQLMQQWRKQGAIKTMRHINQLLRALPNNESLTDEGKQLLAHAVRFLCADRNDYLLFWTYQHVMRTKCVLDDEYGTFDAASSRLLPRALQNNRP